MSFLNPIENSSLSAAGSYDPPFLKVISASRRLEMVGFFPEKLAAFLRNRCPPDRVHSVVLWSKSPAHLLSHDGLRHALSRYEQIFLHLTVTGMGGGVLEPGIPDPASVLSLLPDLIRFTGSAERIRLRFDPIVHLGIPGKGTYSNIRSFTHVARAASRAGIRHVVVSWMAAYPKVIRCLAKHGIHVKEVLPGKWQEEAGWLENTAGRLGMTVHGCCVPGWPVSRCIDGELLTRLHPRLLPAPIQKAGGQRLHCGCTASWDIGWYLACPGGCLYCYANPLRRKPVSGPVLSKNLPSKPSVRAVDDR
ncbi:DUF1848 family protein [bacterium]|nr:DUF1848 family protein [bacterium]